MQILNSWGYASSGFANDLSNGEYSFVGRVGPNGNGGYRWFKEGGAYHSLQEDIMRGEIGDILFMGDENTGMQGHATLILTLPELDKSTGYVEMTVLTSVTDGRSTIKSISFTKNKDGKWVNVINKQEYKGYGQISKDFWWGGSKRLRRQNIGDSFHSLENYLQKKTDELLMQSILRDKALQEVETILKSPPSSTTQ